MVMLFYRYYRVFSFETQNFRVPIVGRSVGPSVRPSVKVSQSQSKSVKVSQGQSKSVKVSQSQSACQAGSQSEKGGKEVEEVRVSQPARQADKQTGRQEGSQSVMEGRYRGRGIEVERKVKARED